MINLPESMGPGRDRTHDSWICSQTHICYQTFKRLYCASQYATRHFNDSAVHPSYMCQTGGPGAASRTPAWSHTSLEIDCEINSTVILFPLLIQEGFLSVIRKSICKKYWLTTLSQACPGKKVLLQCRLYCYVQCMFHILIWPYSFTQDQCIFMIFICFDH